MAIPDPPYPSSVQAGGFAFDLDLPRIKQSRTWLRCPAHVRPWLLMLWAESWTSTPVGTFEDDDEIISARIGIEIEEYKKYKKYLMQGWKPHSDGRVYHCYITTLVCKMLKIRENWANRKSTGRDNVYKQALNVSGESQGSLSGVSEDSPRVSTSSSSSSSSSSSKESKPKKSGGAEKMAIEKITPASQAPPTRTQNIKKEKRFAPPSVEDVAAYCATRPNPHLVNPKKFVDHYISIGWMRGNSKMKDWKATVRTWEETELEDTRNRAFANPANSADPSGSQAAAKKYEKEKSLLQTLKERAESRGLDEQSKATAQKALAQMRQIQRRRIPR